VSVETTTASIHYINDAILCQRNNYGECVTEDVLNILDREGEMYTTVDSTELDKWRTTFPSQISSDVCNILSCCYIHSKLTGNIYAYNLLKYTL
jgi:hypothetical protein